MWIDANDNSPEVRVASIDLTEELKILENTQTITPIGYLYATDADTGKNGHVNCRSLSEAFLLVSEDSSAQMKLIEGTTHQGGQSRINYFKQHNYLKGYKIVAIRPFDREQTRNVLLLINCEDSGTFPFHLLIKMFSFKEILKPRIASSILSVINFRQHNFSF